MVNEISKEVYHDLKKSQYFQMEKKCLESDCIMMKIDKRECGVELA